MNSKPNIIPNAVKSVKRPPTLVVFAPKEQGWLKQFSEEGYTLIHVDYPTPQDEIFQDYLHDIEKEILNLGSDWGLLTYGLSSHDMRTLLQTLALSFADLKAAVHFSPLSETGKSFVFKSTDGRHIPTVFHLPSSQDQLHANLLAQSNVENFDYELPTSAYHPIQVYAYPLVPTTPPFPFLTQAPTAVVAGVKAETPGYLRSAVTLSLTRTLEVFKRNLGPHFDLEKLWDKHTYHEFVDRSAQKTMATMVSTPYVNHIPTMIGGVGFDDLARFYKHHFTGSKVTPADAEILSFSRTVGVDRIVDEMIFKCTHTTEIDYFLPGIPPTGKPLEIALVGIVAFRGDKIFSEHIYWDQASVLVQLDLIDPAKLPIAGAEATRKVLDPFGQASNKLLARWKESEGLGLE